MSEVKSASAGSYPYFLGRGMAVDHDFAAVIKRYFQYAVSWLFKIQAGLFQSLFNPGKGRACQFEKISFVHDVDPDTGCRTGNSPLGEHALALHMLTSQA